VLYKAVRLSSTYIILVSIYLPNYFLYKNRILTMPDCSTPLRFSNSNTTAKLHKQGDMIISTTDYLDPEFDW
jgi:hypothetical protein